MKIAVAGCGMRTPLLIHGLVQSGLPVSLISLFDTAPAQAALMAGLGVELARGSAVQVREAHSFAEAARDCSFLISSFREGGMEARARDEALAIRCGFAGQETTGPAGFAMALRSAPVAVNYAEVLAELSPQAWMINFTNPAGLITQAVAGNAIARVVGICDTPSELFHRISIALGQPLSDLDFDYVGLNHLGWVRAVRCMGEDLMPLVLKDDVMLRGLYPAELFAPPFLRALALLPSEYLFFYYSQSEALRHQRDVHSSRGEELRRMNEGALGEMEELVRSGRPREALDIYRSYLNRRNASYLRLEAAGESALRQDDPGWDPFEGATGYHRIAVATIRALSSATPSRLVLNVPNRGAIPDLEAEDVVEVPCLVDQSGAKPLAAGWLPEPVRGLTLAVKAYERHTIRAALRSSAADAVLALSLNPIVREWKAAAEFCSALFESDMDHFARFHQPVRTS